jgi:hypothetical protein
MKSLTVVLPIVVLSAGQALAQVPTPVTNSDFSEEIDNLVTRQIALPLRYQANFFDGADS